MFSSIFRGMMSMYQSYQLDRMGKELQKPFDDAKKESEEIIRQEQERLKLEQANKEKTFKGFIPLKFNIDRSKINQAFKDLFNN